MTAPARTQEEFQFSVTYDGPDVAEGRMDAQALGGAMLSMAQLLETSAALTFGATTHLDVDVVADFKQGSFSFGLVATIDVPSAIDVLRQFSVSDFLTIIGVTGGGSGLIGLVRWLRRRAIEQVEPAGANEVRVTTRDGDSTVVHGQTVVLLQNSTVRLHLDGVVAPLKREGITEFRTGRGSNAETVVRAEEVEFFEPPPPEGETLQDKVSQEIVQIEGIIFTRGRKWRFRLADGTGFYSHLDEAFTRQVLGHDVVFGAGDALEVDLRTVVLRDSVGNLHAHREIVRVRRHLPPPKQFLLGIGEVPPDGA